MYFFIYSENRRFYEYSENFSLKANYIELQEIPFPLNQIALSCEEFLFL